MKSRKITDGSNLISTRCQVVLDYNLSISCQTLLGSRGFLGCFRSNRPDHGLTQFGLVWHLIINRSNIIWSPLQTIGLSNLTILTWFITGWLGLPGKRGPVSLLPPISLKKFLIKINRIIWSLAKLLETMVSTFYIFCSLGFLGFCSLEIIVYDDC